MTDTDQLTAGFWIHFPPQAASGPAAVQTHLDYFAQTGVDVAKVMCENLQPDVGLLTSVDQWSEVMPMRAGDERFEDQVEIVRAVRQGLGAGPVVIATIHSLVASAFHASGREDDYERDRHIIADHLRTAPATMKAVFERLADSLTELGDACLRAGADGIYLAALGGEGDFLTAAEHAEFIAPLESAMLDHFNQAADYNVLHICKENLDLSRYRDYRPQIVNWSVKAPNPSLAEGFQIFDESIILGGIDNRDPRLSTDAAASIRQMVGEVVQLVPDRSRYVVGADCTLESSVAWSTIAELVTAAHHTPAIPKEIR